MLRSAYVQLQLQRRGGPEMQSSSLSGMKLLVEKVVVHLRGSWRMCSL